MVNNGDQGMGAPMVSNPNPTPVSNNTPQQGGDGSKNTAMAILAYFVFFIPLLTDAKNDPFVKFHVKQSIVLLLAWIVWFPASIILGIPLSFIPIIGPIIGFFLGVGFGFFLFILWIIGLINAAGGKEKPLPLIGGFGSKLSF